MTGKTFFKNARAKTKNAHNLLANNLGYVKSNVKQEANCSVTILSGAVHLYKLRK